MDEEDWIETETSNQDDLKDAIEEFDFDEVPDHRFEPEPRNSIRVQKHTRFQARNAVKPRMHCFARR